MKRKRLARETARWDPNEKKSSKAFRVAPQLSISRPSLFGGLAILFPLFRGALAIQEQFGSCRAARENRQATARCLVTIHHQSFQTGRCEISPARQAKKKHSHLSLDLFFFSFFPSKKKQKTVHAPQDPRLQRLGRRGPRLHLRQRQPHRRARVPRGLGRRLAARHPAADGDGARGDHDVGGAQAAAGDAARGEAAARGPDRHGAGKRSFF